MNVRILKGSVPLCMTARTSGGRANGIGTWRIGAEGDLPLSISEHFSGIRENDRRDGCGLCALPALKAAGVSTFKIVGRGAPLRRKLQLLRHPQSVPGSPRDAC